MKYSSTTSIRAILLLLCIWLNANIFAQVTSLSPYSRFGVGTLSDQSTSNQMSMGNVSSAFSDYATVNFQNPASYSMMLKSGMHVGVNGQFLQLNSASQSEWLMLSSISNIAVNFKRQGGKFGAVIGLTPFSSTGYSITDTQTVPTLGDISYTYDGEGGVNRAYLGAARYFLLKSSKGFMDKSMTPDSSHVVNFISVGANFNYYFGQLEQTRRVIYEDPSYLHSRITTNTTIHDINFDLGVLGLFNIRNTYKGKDRLSKTDVYVGATYSLGNELNTDFKELTETITYVSNFEFIVDTVSSFETNNATITLPQRITLGFGVQHQFKDDQILEFQFDYKMQDWSRFSGGFSEISETNVLANARSYHFGIRFSPSIKIKDAKFFKSIDYRIGARMGDTYLKINDQQISESAISAGFSIPLRKSSTASRIIFGTEIGLRGTTDSNLIKEQFINVRVGLSLSPHIFNNWFVKRQYD
ncbi:MAG: hypothetical protein KDC12_00290 [Flavobacteriales bacterium]|nr:hypothetical protein [Flavobacteriales bacterium]